MTCRTRSAALYDWDDRPWTLPAGWHVVLDDDGHLEEVTAEVDSRTTGEPLLLHFEQKTLPAFRTHQGDAHLIIWALLHELCETVRYNDELICDPHTDAGWRVVEEAANVFFHAVTEPGEVQAHMKQRVLIWDRTGRWRWLPRLVAVDRLKLQWQYEALMHKGSADYLHDEERPLHDRARAKLVAIDDALEPMFTAIVNHDTRIGYPTDWHPSFGTRHINILDDDTAMRSVIDFDMMTEGDEGGMAGDNE